MRKMKSPLVLGAIPFLFVMGLGVVLALPAEPGVTRSNYGRVRVGMPTADVDSIFGGPAKDTAPNGKVWNMMLLH